MLNTTEEIGENLIGKPPLTISRNRKIQAIFRRKEVSSLENNLQKLCYKFAALCNSMVLLYNNILNLFICTYPN